MAKTIHYLANKVEDPIQTISPNLPDSAKIQKLEFVENYLFSSPEQKMALVLLPDKELSLREWRSLWRRILNSPAQ